MVSTCEAVLTLFIITPGQCSRASSVTYMRSSRDMEENSPVVLPIYTDDIMPELALYLYLCRNPAVDFQAPQHPHPQ